jgi:hypothetical protein
MDVVGTRSRYNPARSAQIGALPSTAPMIASGASATATGVLTAQGSASPAFRAEDWMQTLRTLPVGWDNRRKMPALADDVTFYVFYVVGLIVTASSAVFGAPFWFDLMQRLVQARGTGTKPPADRDKDKVTSAATR